ncbi:MAG: ribosome-associated translation inhibitor RaiA [Planctomycetota bacterium]
MQITVTMRHGHLGDSTQERVKAKAEKLTRLFDRLTSIELVIDLKDAAKPRVDLNVSAEHKHDFVSHDQADNLLSAVESAVHKMEQQLRRYKDKVQTRGRDPNAKRMDPAADAADAPD